MNKLHYIAKNIQLAVFDVDGVFTSGQIFFTAEGESFKMFNTLDGHGIKMLQQAGIQTAIITGRKSAMVEKRAADLGIKHLFQGREDKKTAMLELLTELNVAPENTAYTGDDLPDLGAIRLAGLGIAVANAHEFILGHANMVTRKKGGEGAVREICDFILSAQGKLEAMLNDYL